MEKKDFKIVLALSLIRFSYFLDFMIMMPLGKYLMSSLQIDAHQFGILVSSYTFAAGISGMFNTLFVDRFNKKKVLIFIFLNFAIATVFCGLSTTYETLLFCRVYAGLFGGILSSMIYTVLSEFVAYNNRGRAMGLLMASSSVAFILGPPMSLYLTTHYNWTVPFIFLGVLSLILTIYTQVTIPPVKDNNNKSKQSFFAPYVLAMTDKNQRYAILLIVMLAFGQYSTIPYVSPYLQLNLHTSASELAIFLSLGGFFSVVTSIWIGKLSDRFGKHKMSQLSITLSILSLVFLTNLYSTNPFVIGFAVVLFFITITGRLVPSLTIITSISSHEHQSSFMTIQNSIQQFASALASYSASLIIKKDINGIENLSYVGLLGVVSSLIAIYLITQIKDTVQSHET